MSGTEKVVPGRARIGLKKVGLWVPAALMDCFTSFVNRTNSTKTAELIRAIEGHIIRSIKADVANDRRRRKRRNAKFVAMALKANAEVKAMMQ